MAEPPLPNAVIRFEPNGYDVRQPWLMGRQVAGNGFLRAAIGARGGQPLDCFTAHKASAEAFAAMVREVDPAAETGWIRPDRMGDIGGRGGVLYLADATVPNFARLRLPFGPASSSLCGVTHTTATSVTMDQIAGLLTAPVGSWDALICTSTAVLETVRRVHEAEAEALRWRLGEAVRIAPPQLPLIPLGVHCADFELADGERERARTELGVAADEVAVTFVGRLTFSGKHHPVVMYQAMQAVAERTGRRLVLIQCGWAPNETIAEAFRTGPGVFAPDVRTLHVDGREGPVLRRAWAAGDIFMSFSDGIQETFGLTPIEAMAAGLPCIVSDWNGYKDTVEDGVQGFRIPTWAPGPGVVGETMVRQHQTSATTYDTYLWQAASATAVDPVAAADRLAALVSSPDLRRSMGEAGRKRAREVYDWPVIIRQYQALWAELNARREAALSGNEAAWLARAPRASAGWLDPFHAFGHYPTGLIEPATRVTLAPGASRETYRQAREHLMFRYLSIPDAIANAILHVVGTGPATVEALASALRIPPDTAAHYVGQLAKIGVVLLDRPAAV